MIISMTYLVDSLLNWQRGQKAFVRLPDRNEPKLCMDLIFFISLQREIEGGIKVQIYLHKSINVDGIPNVQDMQQKLHPIRVLNYVNEVTHMHEERKRKKTYLF